MRVRAFFGAPLPEELSAALVEARRKLERHPAQNKLGLRFTSERNLHLTLKFLGWMEEEDLPRLSQGAGAIARDFAPLTATARELDAFPSRKRARVVVLVLEDPAARFAALAERLETLAEDFAVERETRSFRSHVTLARLSEPRDVTALLEGVPFAPVTAQFDRLRLYRSTLLPTGSEYSPISEARFSSG